MDGWRNDIGYPEDRDEAEQRLQEEPGGVEEAGTEDAASVAPSE